MSHKRLKLGILILLLCLSTAVITRFVQRNSRPLHPAPSPDIQRTIHSQEFGFATGKTRSTQIESSPQKSHFHFEFGNFTIEEIIVNGKHYSRIRQDGMNTQNIAGHPSLPITTLSLAIPNTKSSSFHFTKGEIIEIPCPPPLPSVGLLFRNEPIPSPQENQEIYEKKLLYPQDNVTQRGETGLGHVKGTALAIHPMQYDFERGVLLALRSLDVTLETPTATEADYGPWSTDWDFAQIQTQAYANANGLRSVETVTYSPGHILLVLPENWRDVETDFVSWKEELGYTVTTKFYDASLDTASSLATEIKELYDNAQLTHLILCGDYTNVPPYQLSPSLKYPSREFPTSDIPYALLSGEEDDYLPDIFISRLPAHSSTNLKNVFSKLIAYEKKPPENDTWRSCGTFLASNSSQTSDYTQFPNVKDSTHIAQNVQSLLTAGSYTTATEIYETDTSLQVALRQQLIQSLNNGSAICYYLGHGLYNSFVTSSFSTTYAKSLENGEKLTFFLAPVCNCGNFAYDSSSSYDCIGEALFLTTTDSCYGASHGASGVICSTAETYWDPPIISIAKFTDQLNEFHSTSRLTTCGGFSLNAIKSGADSAYQTSTLSQALFYTQEMHLLGDCSLFSRFRQIQDPQILPVFNATTLQMQIFLNDSPLPGAITTLLNGTTQQATVSDSTGQLILDLSSFSESPLLSVHDASFRSRQYTLSEEARELLLLPNVTFTEQLYDEDSTYALLASVPELPESVQLSSQGELTGKFSLEQLNTAYICTILAVDSSGQYSLQKLNLQIGTSTVPDADGDDFISNEELLGYLKTIQGTPDEAEKTAYAVALWKSTAKERILPLPFQAESQEQQPLSETSSNPLYLTPEELNAQLQRFVNQAYPLCQISYLGTTPGERETLAIRLGTTTPQKEILVLGSSYGNQRPSMMMALKLAEYLLENSETTEIKSLLENNAIWILPALSPDSCANGIPENLNGHPIFTDFPTQPGTKNNGDPLQMTYSVDEVLIKREEETTTFMRWAASHHFSSVLYLQTGSTSVTYPNESSAVLAQDFDASATLESATPGTLPHWLTSYLDIPLTVAGIFGPETESTDPDHLANIWTSLQPSLLNWLLSDHQPSSISTESPLQFSEERHSPALSEKLVISNWNTKNHIYTIELPAAWELPLPSLGDAVRYEPNGLSILCLTPPAAPLVLSVTTTDNILEEGTITLTRANSTEQELHRCHWFQANSRTQEFSLVPGWNLIGSNITVVSPSLPEGILAYAYTSNQGYAKATELLQGKGYNLYSPLSTTLALSGYSQDHFSFSTQKGWNLLSSPGRIASHQIASPLFTQCQNHLIKMDNLLLYQGFWLFIPN